MIDEPVITPALGDAVPTPARSAEALRVLATRRSTLARLIGEPGPSQQELELIMRIGARVPDHRRLEPWRLVVVAGDDRRALQDRLALIYEETQEPTSAEEREKELDKLASFARAPITICVVSRVRTDSDKARKTPEWEQQLSAGAVCQNLLSAANASGYACQWVTEWCAYERRVAELLCLGVGERVAGFVFIGTALQAPLERQRPKLDTLVDRWRDGAA
jgi:nitroreductase